jgi:hypothetical protein
MKKLDSLSKWSTKSPMEVMPSKYLKEPIILKDQLEAGITSIVIAAAVAIGLYIVFF